MRAGSTRATTGLGSRRSSPQSTPPPRAPARGGGGDEEGFRRLAAATVDRLYAIAHRILRDPDRAQDATQQALFGAWRDLPTLRDHERFEAWLYRLIVHACYAEA